MARATRPDPVDGWHHVMSRGVNHAQIFTSEQDRLDFGRLLGELARRFGIEIHAYCLMGTHFHLLVHCPTGGLSSAMHLLLSSFARIVNDRTNRVGHLFGDRFCSRLVTDTRYLANIVRYIHQNPKDIVDVADIGDYRWSSHRTYLGYRRCPEWLHIETVLGWFESPEAFDRFARSTTSQPGSLDVVAAPDLVAAADLLLAERSDASSRHVPAQRRATLLALSAHMSPELRSRVIDELGISTGGALRTALSRARKLRQAEATIDDTASRLQQLFADGALS